MGDFIFVIRVFLFSITLIFIMQFKIGTSTLEDKTLGLLTRSGIAQDMQTGIRKVFRFIGQQVQQVGGAVAEKANEEKQKAGSARIDQ
jgi:hypothetical protein